MTARGPSDASGDGGATTPISHSFLVTVQPIVLVGGASRRFGRDKLREPWGAQGKALVQYPIEALRAVFGNRVKLVGACDPAIHAMADGIIPDHFPGAGPIGGIISALVEWRGPIFVLAGDMPGFHGRDVKALLMAAERQPEFNAVWACTDRAHPCAGIYSHRARAALQTCLNNGDHALATALHPSTVLEVPVPVEAASNINFARDAYPFADQ